MTAAKMDRERILLLRQQCLGVFQGKSIHDVVGAIEMLVADTLMGMPNQRETTAIAGVDAIATDMKNIIRERYAMQRRGH